MPKKKIKLAHLYPKLLNIYGDGGNILTLKKRCEWRDIELIIDEVNIGDKINSWEVIDIVDNKAKCIKYIYIYISWI